MLKSKKKDPRTCIQALRPPLGISLHCLGVEGCPGVSLSVEEGLSLNSFSIPISGLKLA